MFSFRSVKTYYVLGFLLLLTSLQIVAQELPGKKQSAYNPRFWVDRVADDDINQQTVVADVYSKGWGGIIYWGGNFEGVTMNYFFNSPFLQKQSWAKKRKDGLTPLVATAHSKGLKVMVNIEGVNPYHWQQHKWTPSSIAAVAGDLATAGADAVFEECFEVRPDVFLSLANTLRSNNMSYVSGTDPMLLRESNFVKLWPATGMVNLYNYYLKRGKLFTVATLAQNGSLGLAWAKYWNKPTAMMSPMDRDWGIAPEYAPAVVQYICMIRALQFRVDNCMILGGMGSFDPIATKAWMQEYVNKQEKDRPLMNVVVLFDKGKPERNNDNWNLLFNSGDAITSGTFNAGYNVVVSDSVLAADAYWVFANGGRNDSLPQAVIDLFKTNKPVFLQAANELPSGPAIEPGWKNVLAKCGVDGTKKMQYAGNSNKSSDVSLPEDQSEELPYTGYYKNQYLWFTGADMQRGKEIREGAIIPEEAIKGVVHAYPNKTYGKAPYIVGQGNKYLVTLNALNWEVAYPISNLLSGAGILPASNVWGILGKNVTALLAIEATELNMEIPGVTEGAKLHVMVYDKFKNKTQDEVITYKKPYRQFLKEYDFILIESVGN
ncbi:MAG: hypothetical protein J0I41_19610 [Filimonas sp.]|nr:hypothetical protein [Filimonas sp.]